MTPVRSVRAVGTAGLTARWCRDNRPDFPDIAVWVDAVAEIEIHAEDFRRHDGDEDGNAAGAGTGAGGFGAAAFADSDRWEGFGSGAGDRSRPAFEKPEDSRTGKAAPWADRWERFGSGAGDQSRLGFEKPEDSHDGKAAPWADRWESFAPADAGGRSRTGGETVEDPHDDQAVPWAVDAWSPDYGKVWRPLSGSGREPRPGLLVSVVRAGVVVAFPTPLPDPPTGDLARALARLDSPVAATAERRPGVLAVEVEPAPPPPRRAPSSKTHGEVRALVGMVVEVLVGRRAAAHAARWAVPEVRGKLRTPRYARTTSLKSVRLAESGDGVEALALLRDGGRTRAVALRFDRAEDSRWRCTALQTG